LYDFYFDRNELGQDVWTEWLKLDVCRYKFKEQYLYKKSWKANKSYNVSLSFS